MGDRDIDDDKRAATAGVLGAASGSGRPGPTDAEYASSQGLCQPDTGQPTQPGPEHSGHPTQGMGQPGPEHTGHPAQGMGQPGPEHTAHPTHNHTQPGPEHSGHPAQGMGQPSPEHPPHGLSQSGASKSGASISTKGLLIAAATLTAVALTATAAFFVLQPDPPRQTAAQQSPTAPGNRTPGGSPAAASPDGPLLRGTYNAHTVVKSIAGTTTNDHVGKLISDCPSTTGTAVAGRPRQPDQFVQATRSP